MAPLRSNRGVFLFSSLEFMLLSCTVAATTAGEGIILFTVARKHGVPYITTGTSRLVQLYQNILRGLQKTQCEAFVKLSNGLERITILNASDAEEGSGLEDLVIRYYVVTVNMPFSNLLWLEVGNKLTIDESDITILITNAITDADREDDIVLVNPDLFKDATLQLKGVNGLFHISKLVEENPEEPENGLCNSYEGIPYIVHIHALLNFPSKMRVSRFSKSLRSPLVFICSPASRNSFRFSVTMKHCQASKWRRQELHSEHNVRYSNHLVYNTPLNIPTAGSGKRMKTDVSNITILVTIASAGAY